MSTNLAAALRSLFTLPSNVVQGMSKTEDTEGFC